MDNNEKAQEKNAIKSASKAAGLKSTFNVGGKLYLTSFGKGNDAVLEQQVDTAADYAVSPIAQEPSLHVTEAAEARMKFDSKRPNVKSTQLTADNPLHHGAGNPAGTRRDILGLKGTLEKKYFGSEKEFDDNIHIQIIYNILDIEKILAQYATNISAVIDHMTDENAAKDFIGYMGTINTYDVFMDPSRNPSLKPKEINNIESNRAVFEALLKNRRLGYFGFTYDPNLTEEKNPPKNEKEKKQIEKNMREKKRIYHILAMAGQLRQWCFHGNSESLHDPLWLYQLDQRTDREFFSTLDYYFDSRFREINEHFFEQNKVNLAVLQNTYGEKNFRKIAKRYYDFIVNKSYKNMGFSIKKLRETMLTLDGGSRITSNRMDSVRDKLYKLMDFRIYCYYLDHPDSVDNNVNILRASVSEEEKDGFYAREAKCLWRLFKTDFLGYCDETRNKGFFKPDVDVEQWNKLVNVNDFALKEKVSHFAKLLYVMCFFLDGKEINDLLTTLIHQFDNIDSFIKTGKKLGLNMKFKSDYDFFNCSCARYVAELTLVKNIARMKKPDVSAKLTLTCDALYVLGVTDGMTQEQVIDESKKILEIQRDENNKRLKGKNSFRNFISNNVLHSSRFIYVVKFCNPQTVHRLAENTAVTEFVLGRMPETQIDRYFQSCFEIKNPSDYSLETKIARLAEMIRNMRFNDFKDVENDTRRNPEANKKKERYKAIIGLYLSVVYLLVKNLVNINSRYVMAFHALERDAEQYGVKLEAVASVKGKKRTLPDYTVLTRKLLSEGKDSRSGYLCDNAIITADMDEKTRKKAEAKIRERQRRRDLLSVDLNNASDTAANTSLYTVSLYRNNIAHLTVIRSCTDFICGIHHVESYYALYHYLTQRLLQSKDKRPVGASEKVDDYYRLLSQHNSYVKDFVKALNSPFSYDYTRFKNLSIQELFDRNELQPEPKDDKAEE